MRIMILAVYSLIFGIFIVISLIYIGIIEFQECGYRDILNRTFLNTKEGFPDYDCKCIGIKG